MSSPQVEIVGLQIRGGPVQQWLAAQLEFQGFDDGLRDFILNSEHVGDFAVVALRPEVVSVPRLDQLGGYAEAIPEFAHATFQDIFHVQPLRDAADVLSLSNERERRGARRHQQTRYLHQRIEDVLGQAVAEVFIFLVAAEIGEREHRDRRWGRDGSCRGFFQRLFYLRDALEPLRRLLGKATGDHACNLRRRLGQRWWIHVQDSRQDRDRVFAAEWFPRAEHLIQDHAKGENVRARVHALALRLLRRHVMNRPQDGAFLGERDRFSVVLAEVSLSRRSCHDFRQPEIQELYAGLGHQDVGWLQIPVHCSSLMRRFQRVADLSGVFQGALQG